MRIVLLAVAAFLSIGAFQALTAPTGPRDAMAIAGPTVIRLAPETGGPVEPQLAYSGLSGGRGWRLLSRPLDQSTNGALTRDLLPSRPEVRGCACAQFVPPDRLYFLQSDLHSDMPFAHVHVARWTNGEWRIEERAMPNNPGPNLGCFSIVPPGPAGQDWRMWLVRTEGMFDCQLLYATSHDGMTWDWKPDAFWKVHGSRMNSVSVLPWAGGLRAWCVLDVPGVPTHRLVSFDIGQDGRPIGDPEAVAWQAPELRFGNLPKDAIPIIDARAEPGGDDPRHVRLYITYRGTDARSRITVADNFPVAGERSPLIFARQSKPLVEQGSDRAAPGKNVWLAFSLAAGALVAAAMALRSRPHPAVVAEEAGAPVDVE